MVAMALIWNTGDVIALYVGATPARPPDEVAAPEILVKTYDFHKLVRVEVPPYKRLPYVVVVNPVMSVVPDVTNPSASKLIDCCLNFNPSLPCPESKQLNCPAITED